VNGNPVEIYRAASKRVPAYRDFLLKQSGRLPQVSTAEDFKNLPLTDKTNYILRYPLEELCLDGSLRGKHVLLKSSGTSGNPFYWPKLPSEEIDAPRLANLALGQIITDDLKPTLIVVGLALGPWSTGTTAAWLFRTCTQNSDGVTLATPGNRPEDVLDVLKHLSPHFKQTLLFTYPPSAKAIFDLARSAEVRVDNLCLRLIVLGESISESYRERMSSMIGAVQNSLDRVWSAYGSTDFGDVGVETPLCICMRKMLWEHGIAQLITGENDLPMIFQGMQSETYFEVVNGELVVSRMQGVPVVRYRTGDRADILPFYEMIARFSVNGLNPLRDLKEKGHAPTVRTPFVLLYGRMDGTIFFYGAKITQGQIKEVLDGPAFAGYGIGKYSAKGIVDDQGDPRIGVFLETRPDLLKTDLNKLAVIFQEELRKTQPEYALYCSHFEEKTRPIFKILAGEAFRSGWKF
jgi:phenylacetate-CoA ligase